MENVKIAIIGGTGVYRLPGFKEIKQVLVETEFGSIPVKIGTWNGKKIAFITRHGEKHSIAPGCINYRANIKALSMLGVKQIYSTACVGSVNPDYRPGTFVVLRQIFGVYKKQKEFLFSFRRNTGGGSYFSCRHDRSLL
ncbi:hypothetical protein [Paenibacillus gorillae]|uniref:phosphorylase family protein n=1 Tax=Paenibacillus gorillae TaxID=1243662 RepID=UPI000694789A|nr:hypothetical protein [Paenibacillus gorillae]